jgi:DNA-binding transcriptional MerR regulator
MKTTATYSIGEVARKLELSADWLRRGEKRGTFPPAKRDGNGYRYYTDEDVERLRNRRFLGLNA